MEHPGHRSSSTRSRRTSKARKQVGPDGPFSLFGRSHLCLPCSCKNILGLVEPALITRWLMVLPTRHRPAAPPFLADLPQACLGSGRGAAGEASCRRSQPRGLRGKAGVSKASFLPQRCKGGCRTDGGDKDRAAWSCVPTTRGAIWTPPRAPQPLTASWWGETQLQGFTRAVSTSGWPKARQAAGCRAPAGTGGTCHLC